MGKPLKGVKVCILGQQDAHKPNPRVVNETLGLIALGAEVTWVSPSDGKTGNKVVFLPTGQDVHVKFYPRIRIFTEGLPVNFPFIIGLTALTTHCNIFHVHDMRMVGVAFFLKLVRRRIIYEIGDDNPSLVAIRFKNKKVIMNVVDRFLRAFEYSFLRFFDHVVTLTDWLRLNRASYAKRISTLYYYPFIYYPSAKVSHKHLNDVRENSLVYVGEVSFTKGLKEMVDVTLKLRSYLPDIKLILVGPSGVKERLFLSNLPKANAKEGSTVILCSKVPHWVLPKFISRAKVGLSLLKPFCRSYAIALPLKVLDMMAFGVPVVCFKGMKEVERIAYKSKAVIIVNSFDQEEVTRVLKNLLVDKEMQDEMSNAARKYVEEHLSRAQFEKELLNIYLQVIRVS